MIRDFALTPRQARTGLDLFTGLVIVSVAVALAGLTWRIAGHAGTGAITVPSGRTGPSTAPDVAQAMALAPFGKSTTGDGSQATGLPLELKGVFAANPPSLSVAYISVSGAPAIAFRIGEAAGGGTVQAILRDRVILSNGGRSEFLAFPDPAQSAATGAPPPGAPSALVPGAVMAPGNAPAAAPPQNTGALLQRLDATPVSGGFRIGDKGPPGMVAGDVIQSVNGTQLTDPAAASTALAQAQASGSAQVQIMRDGKRLTLTVPLR